MKRVTGKQMLLKIGELSRESKLPVSTIRHYVRLGLMEVATKTEGGQYLFDRGTCLERLKYIDELSRRGFTLTEIFERFIAAERKAQKKILIIDDENQVDELIRRIIALTHPEWEVRTTNNVFDAGHLLNEYLPHVVVLDINLPAVTGYEICRYIKKTLALNKTKVLAISGYGGNETKEQVLLCGADDFMPKPFTKDKLIQSLEKLSA